MRQITINRSDLSKWEGSIFFLLLESKANKVYFHQLASLDLATCEITNSVASQHVGKNEHIDSDVVLLTFTIYKLY